MTTHRHDTRIFGREREVATLTAAVADGARRILVTGLGGMGKSALVHAVAAELAASGHEVIIVDAAWMSREADLVEALAHRLQAGPVGPGTDTQQLAARLRQRGGRRLTVIIDNADALSACLDGTLSPLTEGLPAMTVIVTSRLPWTWRSARIEPLEPLAVDTTDSAAVALLKATAGVVAHDPAWAGDDTNLLALARRLGGLPLGLVLVARRAALGTPAELLRLLNDGWSPTAGGNDSRQSSVEVVVDWSCARLDANAHACLEALAFTAPGTPRWLLAAVVDGTEAAVVSAMESLVDHGLVVPCGSGGRALCLPNHVRDVLRARCPALTRDLLASRLVAAVHEAIGTVVGLEPIAHETIARIGPAAPAALEALERLAGCSDLDTLVAGLRVATALLVVRRTRAVASEPVIAVLDAWLRRARAVPRTPKLQEAVSTASVRLLMTLASIDRAGPRVLALAAEVVSDAALAGPARVLEAEVAVGIALTYRGRYDEARVRLERAASSPDATPRALQLCHDFTTHARRMQGQLCPVEAERRWRELRERCLAGQAMVEALCLDAAWAVTLFQLKTPSTQGVALAERVIAIANHAGHRAAAGYVRMKVAETLADAGDVVRALDGIDAVLSAHADLTASFEWVEAKLDRALLCLGAGLYDRAAEDLEHVEAFVATPVEVALHRAMVAALAALGGGTIAMPPPAPLSDTVEDMTAAMLHAVASPNAPRPEAARIRHACDHSARARRAAELLARVDGVRARDGGVVLLDRSVGVIRHGATLVNLGAMPLCRRFLEVLVEARHSGDAWLTDRERLASSLWPDERMSTRARDQRIYALVTALRRAGGADLVVVDRGRFAFAPAHQVLEARLGGSAGLGPPPPTPRGRGRPPRRHTADAR